MTDEQKRALEVLENVCTDDCVNKAFVVEPIKQLIQTQQEEIEDLKWKNKIYVKSIKSHANAMEKKDKVIDEMAKPIYDYTSLEVVINCPAEYDGYYNMDLCKMNLAERNCIKCIKEYFINKVEKESKDDN